MKIQNMKLISLTIVLLSSVSLLADKPSWAGNGGKPSQYEKDMHKNEMNSKKEYKKNKKNLDEKKSYEERKRDYNDENKREKYEGQGQTDGEFIEKKVDETKKNWIGKFFDFLN